MGRLIRVHALLLFSVFSLVFAVNVYAHKNLRVGYEEWPPFQMRQEGEKGATGIDIHLTSKILELAGFSPEFHFFPWKRSLHLLKSGGLDVVMVAGISEERREYAHFSSEFYRPNFNVMFVRKDKLSVFSDVNALSDLLNKDVKIGVTLGTLYSSDYQKLRDDPVFHSKLVLSERYSRNLDLLLLGRIDAFFTSEIGGRQLISQRGLENEVVKHLVLNPDTGLSTRLMFSKKTVTPEQVLLIDEAMRKLKEDGTFQHVLTGLN